MSKEIKISIDDALWEELLKSFEGDEKALNQFIVETLEQKARSTNPPQGPVNLDSTGLKDYLQSGKPGSREYGAKGQGW